jgi:hypothetical protein
LIDTLCPVLLDGVRADNQRWKGWHATEAVVLQEGQQFDGLPTTHLIAQESRSGCCHELNSGLLEGKQIITKSGVIDIVRSLVT